MSEYDSLVKRQQTQQSGPPKQAGGRGPTTSPAWVRQDPNEQYAHAFGAPSDWYGPGSGADPYGMNQPSGQGQVSKAYPEGMASYYDDSWLQLLNAMKAGKSPGGSFENLLGEFKGQPNDLKRFLENPAARMALAYGLTNTAGYNKLNDFGLEPSMQALAAGRGQIQSAAEIGSRRNQSALAGMGFGRSGLAAAAERDSRMGAASQVANLESMLRQQRYANLMSQAQQAFDADRLITSMATGYQAPPATPKEDNTLAYVQAFGQLAGAGASAYGSYAASAG